jgi:hypothetical protein
MKTKIASAFGALFLASVFGTAAWAEVALKDNKEILGSWLLVSVAPGFEKPKIEENRTWDFRADGVVVTSGYNRHFKTDDTREFKYIVADGKIKLEEPGRPGKTSDYAVYEKNADSMILKGGMEGFYFFKKK